METLKNCPACSGQKMTRVLQAKDYTVSKNTFDIVRCEACDLLFTNPRPEAEQAGYFYKSENYISHSNTQKGFINKLYHAVRNITLKQKTNLIQGDQQGTKNLLDIGCGNGHFLHACQQRGWNTFGMELDPDTAARAASLTGQSIYPNLQAIPNDPQFELISLWHVLEHVYEIDAYFEFFKKRITPSGKLLLALPNSKSFDARYFKEFWAAYDVPRHIYHFNPETIQSVAKKHGFKLVKQRGQIFDSFYIALLSHEYKTGSKKLVASFFIGLWSNMLAYFKTGNYSSNIYIFEHA
jgi:2-polyprenyl-3-methyl-5-hydroxy-6-metoxy-1,4-benzoquinol methylase